MEFNQKLIYLRKQKNITQEELAKMLYVSRTAISKWESGRGYPSIDYLKALSKLFRISVDDLLSGEEFIPFTQNEKIKIIQNLAFGILDCMIVLLLFLPLFGQIENDMIITVPLLSVAGIRNYILIIYVTFVAILTVMGVAQLALQNWQHPVWLKIKMPISVFTTVLLLTFTIMNRQPYPASLLLCILLLKVIFLIKKS